MKTIYRILVALYMARIVTQLIKQCRVIVTKMTGNTWFPSPTPTLAQVTNDINALDAAEQAAQKGPKGAAAERDVKRAALRSDMRQLKSYVQSICDANMPEAQAIAESAGMSVAKRPARSKPDLAAKYGAVPATVALEAKALRRRASYQWQMSTDQKVWSDLPSTVKAATVVTGLTPATTYYFRFRTLTADGLSDWSPAISIIAH
jgi:hypothetical protein